MTVETAIKLFFVVDRYCYSAVIILPLFIIIADNAVCFVFVVYYCLIFLFRKVLFLPYKIHRVIVSVYRI